MERLLELPTAQTNHENDVDAYPLLDALRKRRSRRFGYNFNINKWSLYAKGGTYLLPVNELTALYINALLETFDETMALFILDERATFRPAGIGRFARSKGRPPGG